MSAPLDASALYAVQPGRGQNAVARIEVVGVRKQPLGRMTHEEAVAAGVTNLVSFKELWRKQHGSFDPQEMVWVIEFKLL